MLRTAALGLALLGQVSIRNLEATDGVYELPSGGKIEALGVCEIGMEKIRCWNRQGAPLDEVARRMEAHYLSNSEGDVAFRFGRKNRYAIFRMPNNGGVSFSGRGDNYGNSYQSRSSETGTLTWVRAVVDADEKEFEIYANIGGYERLPSADLPFVTGRSVEYRGATYEIGESKAMPTPKVANRNPNPYGEDGRPKGKLWSVIMGRRMGASKEGGASQEPLDAKGNPIRYVDANGKAVSEVKYLESVKTDNPGYNRFGNPGVSTKGYVPAYFNASGPATPEAFVITSNIDPKEISAIRLFANQQTRVKFGGLPSDPRS